MRISCGSSRLHRVTARHDSKDSQFEVSKTRCAQSREKTYPLQTSGTNQDSAKDPAEGHAKAPSHSTEASGQEAYSLTYATKAKS